MPTKKTKKSSEHGQREEMKLTKGETMTNLERKFSTGKNTRKKKDKRKKRKNLQQYETKLKRQRK